MGWVSIPVAVADLQRDKRWLPMLLTGLQARLASRLVAVVHIRLAGHSAVTIRLHLLALGADAVAIGVELLSVLAELLARAAKDLAGGTAAVGTLGVEGNIFAGAAAVELGGGGPGQDGIGLVAAGGVGLVGAEGEVVAVIGVASPGDATGLPGLPVGDCVFVLELGVFHLHDLDLVGVDAQGCREEHGNELDGGDALHDGGVRSRMMEGSGTIGSLEMRAAWL